MLASLLSLGALLFQTGSATPPAIPAAAVLPACSFEGGAVLVEHKADLPEQLRSELDHLFASSKGIADAGAFFESADTHTTDAPRARFIRAYHVRDLWFVWVERGGIGLVRHTMAFAPTIDESTGKKVLRMVPGGGFSGDLCAGSKAFLAGARGF